MVEYKKKRCKNLGEMMKVVVVRDWSETWRREKMMVEESVEKNPVQSN
jgi:hypothetical protein